MQRRFLTFILLLAVCIPAALASDVLILDKGAHGFDMLPAEISKDGKAFIYSSTDEDVPTHTYHLRIYNEDFELAKEFVTLPGTPNQSEYSYQVQERESIPTSVTVWRDYQNPNPLDIDGVSENLSIETVLEYLNKYLSNYGEWEISSLGDGTPIVAYKDSYYKPEYFGNKYPERYYREIEGQWFRLDVDYQSGDYAPYGEWKEPRTYESAGIYPNLWDVEIVPLDGSDGEYFKLTRGIFADDFCYVLPKYENIGFSEEYTYDETDWVYKKEWGNRYVVRGMTVYDSTNRVVTTLDLPEGYYTPDTTLRFVRLNNKRYILIYIKTLSDDAQATAVYSIDNDSKVTRIAVTPSTKISPRTPRQGEVVTVTFDESSIASRKTINVVSASGRVVYKTDLPAGEASINLDTSRLDQGLYVVTVVTHGRSQEAAKIIVR